MMPDEDDRVDRFEGFREDVKKAEADGSVDTATIFVGDDPPENPSGLQDSKRLVRDPAHLFVEPRVTARDPPEAPGVLAIRNIVGVR